MTSGVFEKTTLIRFADVDPAGIVFYPRYFEMFNEVVEDWFAGMGAPFSELVVAQGAGVPLAHVEVDFSRPSRLGERLRFALSLRHLGASSAKVEIAVSGDDGEKLLAQLVLVHILNADGRPRPWPDALRAEMAGYVVAPQEEAD